MTQPQSHSRAPSPAYWAALVFLGWVCFTGLVVVALRWPPPGAIEIVTPAPEPSVAVAPTKAAAVATSLPECGTTVDLNSATASELEGLPGIGPALAGRILDYRAANGPFSTVEELLNVEGIGEKTLARCRECLVAR